jgi:hypothetical protein
VLVVTDSTRKRRGRARAREGGHTWCVGHDRASARLAHLTKLRVPRATSNESSENRVVKVVSHSDERRLQSPIETG